MFDSQVTEDSRGSPHSATAAPSNLPAQVMSHAVTWDTALGCPDCEHEAAHPSISAEKAEPGNTVETAAVSNELLS